MRCRLFCAIFPVISIIVAAALAYFVLFPKSRDFVTSDNHIGQSYQSLVQLTCEQYRGEVLSGDLCNRLCYDRNLSITEVTSDEKVEALLKWGEQKLILRSHLRAFKEIDNNATNVSVDQFLNELLETVNSQLSLGWPKQRVWFLIEMLWPRYRRTGFMSDADRRSLRSLVTQREYLTFAILSSAHVFPKLIGTCGSFYATEYVIPFKPSSVSYGNLRAQILIHLGGTLKLLSEFINEPLHWCQVKFESLGLHPDYPKRFIIMDGDSIFTESQMFDFLTSRSCKSDDDCQVFNCRAKCLLHKRTCSQRINDNIELYVSFDMKEAKKMSKNLSSALPTVSFFVHVKRD